MCYNTLVRVSKSLIGLATVVLALFATPTAQAADSTCADHSNNITGWNIQQDHIDSHWHFQCGGANNEDFYISQVLQYKAGDGSWNNASCPNGYLGLCSSFKPAVNWFNGGSDQSGDSGWNPSSPANIDCRDWRMHTTVHFRNGSPMLTYNGVVSSIGGC